MKFTFEEHCTEDALELYALNRLDAPCVESLEKHILICEGCRVRLNETDQFVIAMRNASAALLQKSKSPAKRNWFSMDWFCMSNPTWAAAAVAVFAVAVIPVTQIHYSGTDVNPVPVLLVAERGGSVEAPAHRSLDLNLDARGLELGAQAEVELTDSRGTVLERATVSGHDDTVELRPEALLSAGSYFVRIYRSHSDQPVREFALNVK